jgi:hypothetical protein
MGARFLGPPSSSHETLIAAGGGQPGDNAGTGRHLWALTRTLEYCNYSEIRLFEQMQIIDLIALVDAGIALTWTIKDFPMAGPKPCPYARLPCTTECR